ncbi:try-5, partial [Pristionchus pacificus]
FVELFFSISTRYSMTIRLALLLLLVTRFCLNTAQDWKKSAIDFANSDYDYEGCGILEMRKRVKRSDHPDEYDEINEEEEFEDGMEFQAIGGKSAKKGENPWAVAIMKWDDKSHFVLCAGTLISRRHVVTAAHCLFNGDEYTTKEGGGSSCGMEEYYDFEEYMDITKVAVDGSCLFGNTCDKKEWNSEHLKIVNMSLFPFFQRKCEMGDDLLILTLEKEVRSNHACLPWLHDITLPQSIEVESFGWGSSTQKILVRENGPYANTEKQVGNTYENEMQTVKLGKTDLKCKLEHNSHLEDKICVKELQNVAVCHGDSGAGLLTTLYRKTFVLGVLSSGTDCEQLIHSTGEALFTDLRLFQATIDKTIGTV